MYSVRVKSNKYNRKLLFLQVRKGFFGEWEDIQEVYVNKFEKSLPFFVTKTFYTLLQATEFTNNFLFTSDAYKEYQKNLKSEFQEEVQKFEESLGEKINKIII